MPVPSQGHFFFTVFRLLADFVCLYTYEFWLSLCKIVRSSVILLLPLFKIVPLIILYWKWNIKKFLKKSRSGKTLLLAGPNVWQELFFICNSAKVKWLNSYKFLRPFVLKGTYSIGQLCPNLPKTYRSFNDILRCGLIH